MAKLRYIYSSMNSGKSSNLLQRAHNYIELGLEVIIFTSGTDDRYGVGKVTSRIGLEKPARIIYNDDCKVLFDALKEIEYTPSIKAVFVDECQFLDANQIDVLSDFVDDHNVDVFCYGIKTDFESKLFSGSARLFEIADKVEEIHNICICGEKAIMNARLVQSTDKVLIGGNDVYRSMCRKCFKKHNLKG